MKWDGVFPFLSKNSSHICGGYGRRETSILPFCMKHRTHNISNQICTSYNSMQYILCTTELLSKHQLGNTVQFFHALSIIGNSQFPTSVLLLLSSFSHLKKTMAASAAVATPLKCTFLSSHGVSGSTRGFHLGKAEVRLCNVQYSVDEVFD